MNIQTRRAILANVDPHRREVSFAFSSTAPVVRKFGLREILSHTPNSLDSRSIDRGAVAFLRNHDADQRCGTIVSYRRGRGQNYATARLFDSFLGDLILDEIQSGRTGISCQYQPKALQWAARADTYLVTRWSLLEVSSVPCDRALDQTIGIGRGEYPGVDKWEIDREMERLAELDSRVSKLQYYLI